ncbi:MAG: hypothetical protein K6L73_05215 [Cellvibrionaceae bacterium]
MWEDSSKLLWMAGLFFVWAMAVLLLWQAKDILLKRKRKENRVKEASTSTPYPLGSQAANLNAACQFLEKFSIGARFRAHSEHQTNIELETLVVGFRIDGEQVFSPGDIRVTSENSSLEVNIKSEFQKLDRIKHIQIMVPDQSNDGEALDEAELKEVREHILAPSSRLLLSSTGHGVNELRIEGVTRTAVTLHDGPHAGLKVFLIQVLLDTLEDYEPRTQSRVTTANTIVQGFVNGRGDPIPYELLDISESALRLGSAKAGYQWPEFSEKDHLIVSLGFSNIQLRCVCIREQKQDRIFKIEQISRNSEFKPFGIVDGLELKMHFMYESVSESERSSLEK